MADTTTHTDFLPAEIADEAELERQRNLFRQGDVSLVLDRLPIAAAVINSHRQIVYSNPVFSVVTGRSVEEMLGMRPGEALDCAHPQEEEQGCGTTVFCRYCGAARAILVGLRGTDGCQECVISRKQKERISALNLQVWTRPLSLNGESFCFFFAIDIYHEKRLHMVEKIFYHDLVNLTGGMQSYCELMQMDVDQNFAAEIDFLQLTLERLNELIISHKEFRAAEMGEYKPTFLKLGTRMALEEVVGLYGKLKQAEGLRIDMDPDCADEFLESDRRLLSRVLGNMVKNAVEADNRTPVITVGCDVEDGQAVFWVHNDAVMSDAVKMQVFNRSFTTKGEGRGLGTYSIKLFTENYLGGRVAFTSSDEDGTRFFARIPLRPAEPAG